MTNYPKYVADPYMNKSIATKDVLSCVCVRVCWFDYFMYTAIQSQHTHGTIHIYKCIYLYIYIIISYYAPIFASDTIEFFFYIWIAVPEWNNAQIVNYAFLLYEHSS